MQFYSLLSGFEAATTSWRMTLQSVHYLLFLPLVVGAYFLMPARLRRVWLLLASYYFYLFAAPRYLPVLLAGTLLTYGFGRFIGKAATPAGKKWAAGIGISLSVLLLLFFKYNGFFAVFLSPIFNSFGISYAPYQDFFVAASAIGISFYTFTSIGYLIDAARGDVPVEKNLLSYALFLGFFPSVSSGPISRAGSLLPQLNALAPKADPQNMANGLRRMAVGFFKKLAIANTLAVFPNHVFSSDLSQYSGPTLMAATLVFALQLYFDFSGYSDIAIASAQLLGITLPENFNTPYFATNFSGFWSRWHMSLSTWLQDYIFTPLVWSRWPEKIPFLGKKLTKPPVLSSIAIVFLISGIWHGDTLSFVVWGALQAVYRIGEELLHRVAGKPKKKPPLASRIGKTAVVLLLWVQSLLFFRIGMVRGATVSDAFAAFARQFSGFSAGVSAAFQALGKTFYDSIYFGVYQHSLIVNAFLLFSFACLAIGLYTDWLQFTKLKGKHFALAIPRLAPVPRWLVYYFLVLASFAGLILANGGFAGGFLYGGF